MQTAFELDGSPTEPPQDNTLLNIDSTVLARTFDLVQEQKLDDSLREAYVHLALVNGIITQKAQVSQFLHFDQQNNVRCGEELPDW